MQKDIELREALRQAIDEELKHDENVFILGEDIGKYQGPYKVTKGLLEKWGDKRIIDTPICEASFSGLAIGAALTGLRPIVEFMSWNFSFVAIDQLISNVATLHYMSGGRFHLPIVFRGPNGLAMQVAEQHSHNVESIYSNIPGWVVVSPSNSYDAKGLLKTAIRSNNPVLFLENELLYREKMDIPEEEYFIPFGKAKTINEGTDVTVISYSRMINLCKEAMKEASKKGISVELIDIRTIKPLDIITIAESIKKTNKCVIVEEGNYFGGISSEIGFEIMHWCFDYLDAPIERLCQKETPVPYSSVLEKASIPSKETILYAIEKVVS